MAAQLHTSRAPAARTFSRPQDESWKAQGFINLYINAPDGSKKKLGAIPLKDARNAERTLREWLGKDPEKHAAKLLSALSLEYRAADEEGPAMDFDALGAPAAPAPEKK